MRINSVRVKAFRGFNKEQIFNLAPALVLIHGNNGFGKTSLFDAIEWALTGKISRYQESAEKSESEYITNRHAHEAGESAEVDLHMDSDGVSYKISRIRSGEVRVYRNGEPLGASIDSVLSVLTNPATITPSLDRNEFPNLLLRSILLTQDQISDFLSDEKPPGRFASLSKMLGTRDFGAFPLALASAKNILANRLDPIRNVIEATSHDLSKKVSLLKEQRARKVLPLDVVDEAEFIRSRLKDLLPATSKAIELDAEPFSDLDGPAILQFALDWASTGTLSLELRMKKLGKRLEQFNALAGAMPRHGRDRKELGRLGVAIVGQEKLILKRTRALNSYQSAIGNLGKDISALETRSEELASREQDLEDLSRVAPQFVADSKRLIGLKLQLAPKKRVLRMLKGKITSERGRLKGLRTENAELLRKLKLARRSNKDLDVLLTRLLPFAAGPACPACGTDWHDTKSLQNAIQQRIGHAAFGLTSLEKDLASRKPQIEQHTATLERLEASLIETDEQMKMINSALEIAIAGQREFLQIFNRLLGKKNSPGERAHKVILDKLRRHKNLTRPISARLEKLRLRRQRLKALSAEVASGRAVIGEKLASLRQEQERISGLMQHAEALGRELEIAISPEAVSKGIAEINFQSENLSPPFAKIR